MELVPLIETTRGGTRECVHFGALAVVDPAGRVQAQAGNPHWQTFTRSTLKALQALPFVHGGGAKALGLEAPQLALLCASHNGEPSHVREVETILAKAQQGYRRLQCGCHMPYYVEHGVGPAPASFDERHHNCSGKHAGFLACCVHQGWPLENYLDPAHPLQQAIRRDVARAAGVAADEMPIGIDGCSAPNYALPLSALARAYARIASGRDDGDFGEAFDALGGAMSDYPELVSGTGRNDAAFMRAGRGDWITKVGADGVQVVASRSRREALAIKISDGSKPALFAATVAALDQLGWLDDAQRSALEPWRGSDILSVRGAVVGARRPVFSLAGG